MDTQNREPRTENREPRTESQEHLQTPRHSTLIFKPQKTWVMRINIKVAKGKPTTIKLLVQAEDYITAKEIAEDFVNQYTESKVYISNVTGNALDYEYLLKHKPDTDER